MYSKVFTLESVQKFKDLTLKLINQDEQLYPKLTQEYNKFILISDMCIELHKKNIAEQEDHVFEMLFHCMINVTDAIKEKAKIN